MEVNFILGNNGGHRPSSLGGRSIVVVSEWDEMLAVFKNFKIWQLQFESIFKLFEWIYGGNSIVSIDLWQHVEGKCCQVVL